MAKQKQNQNIAEKPVEQSQKLSVVKTPSGDRLSDGSLPGDHLTKLADATIKHIPPITTRAAASGDYLRYRNIVDSISVRNSYSERDYYDFRENEKLPTSPKGIMAMGMKYYKTNPIVKNTIDMMSEFAANGMVINHKSERIQRFYRNYAEKIGIYAINEQFGRIILKAGAVVISRSFVKMKKAQISDMLVGVAEDQDFPRIEFVIKEIPIGYSFLNPLSVTLPHENIALFVGGRKYYLELPQQLVTNIRGMKKDELKEFAAEFPPEIVKRLKSGETSIPLDPNKVTVIHYKKDDFETWGEPIHACILDDLIHYDKVKLADRTTLDSIASRIRLWKLGHLDKEYTMVPGEDAFNTLSDTLATIPSGGVADIIWNPAITVEELSKDAYQFLTSEKYKAPLSAIYQGLGVPRTTNDDNSFNNSYFGLKTMVERLNYLRNILKSFWTEEFKKVHLALGFPGQPPSVYFDEISVANREQTLALVRDLVDRNLISEEEGRRIFNADPEVEAYRVKKEMRRKKKGQMPPKAGPFHNTTLDIDLQKIAFQKGVVKPQDVGIETSLSDKEVMDIVKPKPPKTQIKGQPGQGRPKLSNDKNGRKKRTIKPRSAMSSIWYTHAQANIHNLLLAQSLEKHGKKNQRQLSTAETERIEKEKFAILYNIEYGTDINEQSILGVSNTLEPEILDKYNSYVASFVKTFGRQPNIDEQRIIQVELCLNKGTE